MLAPVETIPTSGGVPIRLFLTPELMPDALTMAQLEQLARTSGLTHYIAVLPDVHRKARNPAPTGIVVVAKDVIVPSAVDTGISCGTRMVSTDIDARDLTVPLLDQLFGEIQRTMPPLQDDGEVISTKDVADIFVRGGEWCCNEFDLSEDELDSIEDRGRAVSDTTDREAILSSVPQKVFKKGQRRFGSVGGGNHFLELQEIVDILDKEAAALLGLRKGKALFMLHTDSRGVGGSIMRAQLEELARVWPSTATGTNGFRFHSIPAESEEGTRLALAVSAAANFGFANRIAVTEKLRASVRKILRDQSLSMPLLYDCAHVSIKSEQWRGERLWVHRHGASRALPPSQFPQHPIFSRTGQPVAIPGSMGHDSLIAVAEEAVAETFYSINHGAGRTMDKPEALTAFTNEQVEREMRSKNIRLYRNGSDNIAEQAPGSFKDISQVIEAVSGLGLARPVVRLRPLAVSKG
ncbi:MAG TPA: RtcB family protein [Nitrospirales bacterium]